MKRAVIRVGKGSERKKPGPVANPNLVKTSVSLYADQIEWGKKQPGGLSDLLRRLLEEAREKAESAEGDGSSIRRRAGIKRERVP